MNRMLGFSTLTRRALLISATALLPLPLAAPAFAQSDGPIQVVATFSILGDMVKRIGGEHVAVKTLVGPNGDAHVYQPTPADARTVSEAEILVVNGLEFEGWLDRLVDATDFDGMRVVATAGIKPISFDDEHDEHDEHEEHAEHDEDEAHEEHAEADRDDHHHGAFDPHAWQSFANAVVYVDNITAALSQANPANATDFYQNRAAYVAEIEALDAEIREIMEGLPADHRTVVTSHDAFLYFARYYGLTFVAPQGLSTESEASAKDVA
ncbi:MAG: zinc ABC transporter substrate-binding protein, partial [Gammaproteobacteria bacterium]|nr:zinc ABC transporter substrate-binding protein [Gammaproteobacteria bacterium]